MAFDKLSEHLLEYGDTVAAAGRPRRRTTPICSSCSSRKAISKRTKKAALTVVAPRGSAASRTRPCDELFTITRKDTLGKHATDFKGAGQVRHEDSKPYEFGDPVANLNLHETLKNAVIRQGASRTSRARRR